MLYMACIWFWKINNGNRPTCLWNTKSLIIGSVINIFITEIVNYKLFSIPNFNFRPTKWASLMCSWSAALLLVKFNFSVTIDNGLLVKCRRLDEWDDTPTAKTNAHAFMQTRRDLISKVIMAFYCSPLFLSVTSCPACTTLSIQLVEKKCGSKELHSLLASNRT